MEERNFFGTEKISALSLGGGGIGQVWGNTTRQEAVDTLREAVNCGINWIDVAPGYGDGEAERVVALAFSGTLPTDVRVSTKCRLITGQDISFSDRLNLSLEESLERMQLESVALLMLHNMILDPLATCSKPGCDFTDYQNQIVPALLELERDGAIKSWGITGIGLPASVSLALRTSPTPHAVQIITNALDSAGDIQGYDGIFTPRNTISEANENGVGVMGIRAVQAGALTEAFDRAVEETSADMEDYKRASGFRVLARRLGMNPAHLAHRYALSMDGVATVVLGVKNRRELYDCLDAEDRGKLDYDLILLVDEAVRSGDK